MADFRISYSITKRIEGGHHDGTGANANDRGGETFKGIARRMHPTWAGWPIIDRMKGQPGFPNTALNNQQLQQLVWDFYKREFWDVSQLDNVTSQAIANEIFDTAVNMGNRVAVTFLQRALNLLNRRGNAGWQNITTFGNLGPVTLGIVNRLSPVDTRHAFNLMNIMQGQNYIAIAERDETQEDFIRGWLERVELMRG